MTNIFSFFASRTLRLVAKSKHCLHVCWAKWNYALFWTYYNIDQLFT